MAEQVGRIGLHRETSAYEAGYSVLAAPLSVLEADLSWLHPRERAYLDTLRVGKRRESYLIGRRAAKLAIGSIAMGGAGAGAMAIDGGMADGAMAAAAMAGVAIEFGVFQFPVVKSADLHNMQVSFSHCDGVAVALAFPEDHPMGVDLELMTAENIETMSGTLSAVEAAVIERCMVDRATGAAICWTAREALSKIFRTGLTIDCKVLELSKLTRGGAMGTLVRGDATGTLVRGEELYHGEFTYAAQYRTVSAVIGSYVCSVVLPRRTAADLGPFFGACRAIFAAAPESTAV